jgi:hypothetical protein
MQYVVVLSASFDFDGALTVLTIKHQNKSDQTSIINLKQLLPFL